MDYSISPTSPYTLSGVPVVIKHLATTRMAKASSDHLQLELPFPALDAIQMDSFIDIENRMCDLKGLGTIEVRIASHVAHPFPFHSPNQVIEEYHSHRTQVL
jgi:hypothetical protein